MIKSLRELISAFRNRKEYRQTINYILDVKNSHDNLKGWFSTSTAEWYTLNVNSIKDMDTDNNCAKQIWNDVDVTITTFDDFLNEKFTLTYCPLKGFNVEEKSEMTAFLKKRFLERQ